MASVGPTLPSLYSRCEEVLGAENVDTLMTDLPRHEAVELATVADNAVAEARFECLEPRFDWRLDQVRGACIVRTVDR